MNEHELLNLYQMWALPSVDDMRDTHNLYAFKSWFLRALVGEPYKDLMELHNEAGSLRCEDGGEDSYWGVVW